MLFSISTQRSELYQFGIITRLRNQGTHGPRPLPFYFLKGPALLLLHFLFCLKSLGNIISIGSTVKVNRLMKKILQSLIIFFEI